MVVLRLTPALGASLALTWACGRPPSGEPLEARLPGPPPPGLDLYVPVPEENPLTPEKVALGRRLFFDPVLSRDSTVACVSCHRPGLAFGDSVRFSRGVDGRRPSRNTPTLVNRAYGRSFFWDGRAPTLEETVLQPIANRLELDLPLDSAVARLAADVGYRDLFRRAFAAEPGSEGSVEDEAPGSVSSSTLARALASYVRTIRVGGAPVDLFVAGDRSTLERDAIRGRRLFLGKANCSACHAGPTFSDEGFHNTGVSWGTEDTGRHLVTGVESDRGRFRTPTLRELVHTAPYMHDGSIPSLEAVVDFYDGGGNPNPNLDPEIWPLRLTAREKRELVAFLRSLSTTPATVRPSS